MSKNRTILDAESGMVRLGALTPETRWALQEYSQRWGYDEWLGDRSYIQSHWCAWLIELLKVEKDDPQLFPKGQWATIQRMEEMMQLAARNEIDERGAAQTGASGEGRDDI